MPFRTVLVPPLVRAVRPWTDLAAYADLLKHFRDVRPDVVHTHSSKAGILGRRAARAAAVRCIVHTIHGLPFDVYQGRLANWAYRAAERRAARWSHRLIAVSRDMAERAADAGLAPPDRPPRRDLRWRFDFDIAVVYSGMDVERFRAAAGERQAVRREWGAEPDDLVFLKVARLFALKGHEFVLPAMAEVARRHPRTRLILAGAGILRPQVETEVARLGLAGRVLLLGLVPPEKMPGAFWAADAVVHAGLREGLARVLPQAGVCGRPVVAYNIGGAREVVRDGENGYLLDPPAPGRTGEEAWRPLAEAMGRLAADPAAARRMGGRWPPEVLAKFDYREATRRIMQVYEAVLGGR
jgi:glycosyltransferase involved in cell wall biosynthesis